MFRLFIYILPLIAPYHEKKEKTYSAH